MKTPVAFETSSSFADLYSKLNELGPWTWRGTESDTYGDYLSTNPDHRSWIKIFACEGHWVVQLNALDGSTFTREQLEREMLERVLPGIGARNVHQTEAVY